MFSTQYVEHRAAPAVPAAIDWAGTGRHSTAAMASAPAPHRMIELMARETRCRLGPVPAQLGGTPVKEGRYLFAAGQFALRTDSGYAFHYVPGDGVTIERSPEADPAELELWLSGSVYAAVACFNGLYPVHASAVADGGRVHAFTGPSGAGKSTLVAGLGNRGLPLFCDDTMLLDLSDPDLPLALPGHKRMKLTDYGLELTGAASEGPVGSGTGKSYASPPAGTAAEPLPLATLTFLEAGEPARIEPIRGAQRFAVLEDDHYTQAYFAAARMPTAGELFDLRARLAQRVVMARLVRPLSTEGFAKSLDLAETAIRSFGKEIPA